MTNQQNWASDPTRKDASNITADHGAWATVERHLEYDGDFAKVFQEKVITPTRPEGVSWTVVRRKCAVTIAARTTEGKWLLVHQERIPIRRAIWEFPAGQIEMAPGDFQALLRETVWRELREETGYTASADSQLTALGVFFPSAGFTDEHSYIFLADALVPHPEGARHDEAERITDCRAFSSEELRQRIATGEICDANTLATFARLVAGDFI